MISKTSKTDFILKANKALNCGSINKTPNDCLLHNPWKFARKLEIENNELKEFIIWMTGCGYDFCQHDYFCKMRDKLLKKD